MNFIGKMLLRMAGVKSGESFGLTDAAAGKVFASGQSIAGKSVNDETAMRLSVAWCCNRILAETIGALPWKFYSDDGNGDIQPAKDYPLSQVLTISPNAEMTSVEFRESLVLDLCMDGNAYCFIDRVGDLITTLTPIPARTVTPKRGDDHVVYFDVLENGRHVKYPREKIWHVKGFGRGLSGLSPIAAAREAMGVAMATEDFGARFFSQGGMPSGIVTTEKFLNQDQRVIARENLNQMLSGLGNAHKFALFEGGMKPEPWGAMPLEDMQFLELRQFSILEICRFYRIPPHMVADLSRATFSNIEHLSQEFVMFTLMPYFTRFEASVTKWLLPLEDRGKVFLRFNYEGLLRADSAGRAAFYSQMAQNGLMSRNEIRSKENLSRVTDKGMDDYTIQLNMTTISKVGQTADTGAPNVTAAS